MVAHRFFARSHAGRRKRILLASALLACAAVPPASQAQTATGQTTRLISFSGAFGDHVARVLYRSGRYGQAVTLVTNLLDAGLSRQSGERSLTVRRANAVSAMLKRAGNIAAAPLTYAVQVKAIRYWMRGDEPAIAFVSRGARVMGWATTGLAEVQPLPLAAALPGGAGIPVVRTASPVLVVASHEPKPAPHVAPATEPPPPAAEPPKPKSGLVARPAALGAGPGVKKVRRAPQGASVDEPKAHAAHDDWTSRVFAH